MLRVRTELRESEIHGVGVFAVDDIPVDAVVWTFNADIDKVLDVGFSHGLGQAERAWFEAHATQENGFWLLDGDNAKYINHSTSPNLRCEGDGAMVSVRHIYAGEEITSDYREFCELRRQDPFYGGGN